MSWFQAPDFSPVRSSSREDGDDEHFETLGGEEQEGFICPTCMRGFASPEGLQVHYEEAHGSEASLGMAKKSQGHFHDLKVRRTSFLSDNRNLTEKERKLRSS